MTDCVVKGRLLHTVALYEGNSCSRDEMFSLANSLEMTDCSIMMRLATSLKRADPRQHHRGNAELIGYKMMSELKSSQISCFMRCLLK